MALNGKHVSLKNIIAKVYRDLKLTEEEEFVDFIEWGAEALEQIGVFEQLETKGLCIPINFYKAELPCDLVYINYIGFGNQNLLPSNNLQGVVKHETEVDGEDSTGLSIRTGFDPKSLITAHQGLDYSTASYTISNGFIHVSEESGDLHISYQAMPLDSEGYPLVPDDVSFREAVYRYIVYKWIYPKYLRNEVQERAYRDAEDKWLWYCGQAGAKAQMPNLAKMESIARSYLSLRPNTQQFKTFFEDLNKSII